MKGGENIEKSTTFLWTVLPSLRFTAPSLGLLRASAVVADREAGSGRGKGGLGRADYDAEGRTCRCRRTAQKSGKNKIRVKRGANSRRICMGITKDADPITCNMVLQILQQEVEHEEDLQALLEDFELMMGTMKE
jgi:hypothetical protein